MELLKLLVQIKADAAFADLHDCALIVVAASKLASSEATIPKRSPQLGRPKSPGRISPNSEGYQLLLHPL
jgi:hypothetical protein